MPATTRPPHVRMFLPLLLGLALNAGAQSPNPPRITLTAPQDYQVVQRQTAARGTIVVEGSIDLPPPGGPAEPEALEARLVLSDPTVPSRDWEALPFDRRVRRFRGTLPAPAGGWHRLEVRLRIGAQTLATTTVSHLGVGEIFIVAGQSNSANHGAERQRTGTGRVAAFGQGRWQPADDPQPGASGAEGSFIPPFGDALAVRLGVPIGILAIGAGGTSVREWLPEGDLMAAPPTTGANAIVTGPARWACTGALFQRLTDALRQVGPHGCRAILWHQGESDNHQPPDREISPVHYRGYLQRVIEASRTSAGWRVPWFVAEASYHTPDDPGSAELRAAQRSLVTDGIAFSGPNTDELGTEFRDLEGRGVHFNGAGLRRHGRLWAEAVGQWLEADMPPVP